MMCPEITTNGINERSETKTERSRYWFEDATLTIRIQDAHFRVHHSFIARHSPLLGSLDTTPDPKTPTYLSIIHLEDAKVPCDHGCRHLAVKEAVAASDFEHLLSHLYHDEPLTAKSDFHRVASILRVSGSDQLHFPRIHDLARSVLEDIIPSDPLLLKPDGFFPFEALALATKFDIWPVRRTVLYWLVTTHHFDEGAEAVSELEHLQGASTTSVTPSTSPNPSNASLISETNRNLCQRLLDQIINHFTPILYTPATGSHMACTDRFADMWMPHVIQPSFGDDGVYKPLETLERIKTIDWEAEGICSSCTMEKREEWTQEQDIIWRRVDEWVRGHGK